MDASIEARRLADELEQTGLALEDEAGAELLQKAAEIRAKLGEQAQASALLRQGLQRFPTHLGLLEQALALTSQTTDHEAHAELLGLAVKAVSKSELKAQLLSKRGDVVGLGLGRLAEARGIYRDALRLTDASELESALEAVLLKIELHLEARASVPPQRPVWAPVFPGPVQLAPAPSTRPMDSLAAYQARLQRGATVDPTVLGEAVRFGINRNIVGIAARLLPEQRVEVRVELLEQLATGAEGVGDEAAALDLWVAALEDSPGGRPYEDELEDRLADAGQPRLYARYLRARARHSEDYADKKRLLGQAQRKAESAADLEGAAEAVLESLRLPGLGEDLERLLATADRLSLESRDRTILTRALGAAAAHQELSPERRGRLLDELARILEVELGDLESAQAVRAEQQARSGPLLKDTVVDEPSPLQGGPYHSARPWAEEVETPLPLLEEAGPAELPDEDEPLLSPEPANATRPPQRQASAPPLAGREAVRIALSRGELLSAVQAIEACADPPVALWLGIGRLALALLETVVAEQAFAQALALAPEGPCRREALLGAEQVARRQGATKEVARLLAERVTTFEDRADHPAGKEGRQRALLAVAEAHVRARQRAVARTWLVRAVEVEATAEALAAWLRLVGDDGDPAEVERVWSQVDLQRYPASARAGLLVARAGALISQGDTAGAVIRYEEALAEDSMALRPAEELLAIGIGASDDRVIDLALEALRARLLGLEPTRAFLAAACRVARGGAPIADRQTYELGRLALSLRPTTVLSKGWLGQWLGLFRGGADVELEPALVGPELELSPAERSAVSDVEAAFGLSGTTLHPSEGPGMALLDRTPPRLGVPPALRGRARRLRFELGRALAAVVEPQLGPAFQNASGPEATPELNELVLDRAGLVVGGDPKVALEALGPHTPRGVRLLAFATSRGLVELWGRLGIRVSLLPALTKPHLLT